MASRKDRRYLSDNGFHPLRTGVHEIWTDGKSKIALHKGSKDSSYAYDRLRSQVRRAIEKRVADAPTGW